MIFLDTHVVVWLYAGEKHLFTKKALDLIEENDISVSPMAILEIQFLKEIGRVTVDPYLIVKTLSDCMGVRVSDTPFSRIVGESISFAWTRDPFDRLIVADAAAHDSILLTKDASILKHYHKAAWR